MKALAAPKTQATFLGAIKNVGRGLYNATAKFSTYASATPSATTSIGSRYGSNPNSTIAGMQRVALNWTAERAFKDSAIAAAYISQRINYCSSMIRYIPATGDTALDADIIKYLHGSDGCGGVFGSMGVDCSMQDAFSRSADLECPVRGDAGMIFWRDLEGQLRLIEFSSDQLGEIYNFTMERYCGLKRDSNGCLYETVGNDVLYQSGRYFRGPDCIGYKIYQRTNAFYANPFIYDAADVIYFRDPASMRGIRGVSKFATALQHMEKGETLFQTGMDAALRQSKTAMIVMNQNGTPDEGTYETDLLPNGSVRYREQIAGGPQVEYFYNGDSANFASPDSPGSELIEGVETSDERVAISLGLNYAFLISCTKVGGAPSRLEIEKASKEFGRIQNTIHRPRLNRIRDVVLLDAVRQGILKAHPRIKCGRWVLPIAATVDAGYSNDENITNLRSGLECPQDLVAETNRDWKQVVNSKKQAAIDVAMAVEDGNRELVTLGYKGTITALDIAQLSDNPQQQAAAENITEGKSATGDSKTAKMSEFEESKHSRNSGGEFGHGAAKSAANEASKKASGDAFSPSLHNDAAEAHSVAVEKINSRISEVKSDPKLNDTDKKKLISGYKKDVAHHQYMTDSHKRAATELDKLHSDLEKKTDAKMSEFEESKHPRAKDGEFGSGGKSDSNKFKISSSIESISTGSGSRDFYHGTRNPNPEIHTGQTFADNPETASRYSNEHTLSGNVSLDGLKIAKVKSFDRNDANYGAIGDSDSDIEELQKRGVDLLTYEDEDPSGNAHTAYRVVSDKAKDRFKSSLQKQKRLSDKSRKSFKDDYGFDNDDISDLEKNGTDSDVYKKYIEDGDDSPEVKELIDLHKAA